MIGFLLTVIAVIAALQLIVMLTAVVAIRHDTAAVDNLHTTVDDIQGGLTVERNLHARWQG